MIQNAVEDEQEMRDIAELSIEKSGELMEEGEAHEIVFDPPLDIEPV